MPNGSDLRGTHGRKVEDRGLDNKVAGSPPTVRKPTYDRTAAVEYAHKYWNRVCSDGFAACKDRPKIPRFYEKVPVGTVFEKRLEGGELMRLPDGSAIPGVYLDDCTHFVSCCIGSPPPPSERAGGLKFLGAIPMLGAPGQAPYGIISVPELAKFLSTYVAKRVEPKSPQSLPTEMEAGDVIVYKDKPDGRVWRPSGQHAAIYLGNGRIACHTWCRWNEPWDTSIGFKYHNFFHIIK